MKADNRERAPVAVRRGLLEGLFPGRPFAYGPFIEALGLLLSGTAQRRLRPLLWLLSVVIARAIRDLQIRAEKVHGDRDDERRVLLAGDLCQRLKSLSPASAKKGGPDRGLPSRCLRFRAGS
jgi:hypothetical protein